jgi:hypothetical protein
MNDSPSKKDIMQKTGDKASTVAQSMSLREPLQVCGLNVITAKAYYKNSTTNKLRRSMTAGKLAGKQNLEQPVPSPLTDVSPDPVKISSKVTQTGCRIHVTCYKYRY